MNRIVCVLAALVAAALLATSAGLADASRGIAQAAGTQADAPAPDLSATIAVDDDLDQSFGTSGTVVVDLGPGGELGGPIALQPDGKIVAGGSTESGAVLVRLSSDGALDPTFGSGGVAPAVVPLDLAIQADGKVVVATSVPLGGGYCCRFAVARYNADGTPDTMFDDDGQVVLDFAYAARAVAIQPDGRIVAAGSKEGGLYAMAVARLESDGSVDSTFDGDGTVLTTFDGESGAEALALQEDGRIVVAGYAGWYNAPASHDFALVRYNTDGSLDTTFDGDGRVTTDFGGSTNYDRVNRAHAVAIQSDGRIVVAGDGFGQAALARYNTDGSLDPTYSDDGVLTTRMLAWTNDIGVQADGMIVAAGRSYNGRDDDFALARTDSRGRLDGFTSTDLGDPAAGSSDEIHALRIQPDGKILVAGSTTLGCQGACHWVVARYSGIRPITELIATPAGVGFGPVMVGGEPAEATVTVTNLSSSTAVEISLVALAAGPGTGITVTSQGCPIGTLGPKASCVIVLEYAPPSNVSSGASLTIESDATSGTLVIPISGYGFLPPSGVSWGTRYKAGPPYTWNGGSALGRTVQSGTQRLHLAYTTPRIGSRLARDTGPYAGIYYVRSTSGATWSTPKRVNPSTQHAMRLGLAAAGSRVYVAWVSQKKVVRYTPTAPRVLFIRVNTSHGASTKWKSPIRLTSTTGRVDYPTVAASGYDVYVAYTDANTGSVKVAVSHDRGATWTKKTVGATTHSTTDGKAGWPSVAVHGSTVAVAWSADASGRVLARVSTDRGASWGDVAEISPQSLDTVNVAVRGTRVAVAWTTSDDVVLRQRIDGIWGDPLTIASGALVDQAPFAPIVILQDPGRIAIAWAEEVRGDAPWTDLRWAESADGGKLWFETQTLAAASSSSTRRGNDWASVVWPSAGTRYVVWNGWTYNSSNYRLYLRKGTGTPVGPTVTATAWEPTSDAPVSAPDFRDRSQTGPVTPSERATPLPTAAPSPSAEPTPSPTPTVAPTAAALDLQTYILGLGFTSVQLESRLSAYNQAVVEEDLDGVIEAVESLMEFTGSQIEEAELRTVPTCAREHYGRYLAWLREWVRIARMLPKAIEIDMGRWLEINDAHDAANDMQKALNDSVEGLCP